MLPFSVYNRMGKSSATVAQQAEQLICNQRVGGSIPFGGSKGEVPEWPKGADCKSAGAAFGGSNPPLSTSKICRANFAVSSIKLMNEKFEKRVNEVFKIF